MDKDDPKPENKSAGNRPPPRPPSRVAVALGPEGDDSDKKRRVSITKAADGEGKFIRQSGGIGHHGHVIIKIEPNDRGNGILISNETPAGTIPEKYIPHVTNAVREALDAGVWDGRPIVDIVVRIVGGSSHESDSNEVAFKMAGIFAIKDALKKAAPLGIK